MLNIEYLTDNFYRTGQVFYLEELPMDGDYDYTVHEYIELLKNAYMYHDRFYYDSIVEDLKEYYQINEECYEF